MKCKKITAVLLACLTAFSCCSAAVYAANEPIPQVADMAGDDLDSAFLEQNISVSLMPEAELAQAASVQDVNAITAELQSVTKPAKGTGTAFTLKDCLFPGFSDRIFYAKQTFFQILDTLGCGNTFSGEYKVLPDGTAEIVRIDSALPILLMPSTIGGKTVTRIGERAVAGGLETTVKLLIGSYKVEGPTVVFLPPTVNAIGDKAFAGCTALTNVVASGNVETIGDLAFAGCCNLRKVLFYSDIRQQLADANRAMYEIFRMLLQSYLNNGTILDLLKEMLSGTAAWIHENFCYNEKLREIGRAAFYGCEKLVRFYIPKVCRTIGEYAFYGCKSLKEFVINNISQIKDGLLQIRDWALANVQIDKLYIAYNVALSGKAFDGSVIGELTFGGNKDKLPDALKKLSGNVRAAVQAAPVWKDNPTLSAIVDRSVFATDANLTFKSLDADKAIVMPDGTLKINGVGDVQLVCVEEDSGTLNEGVQHGITITIGPAEVQSALTLGGTVPYKREFEVKLNVQRTSDGQDVTAEVRDYVEWSVSGVKAELHAEGAVCRIKCTGTGTLNVTATVRDAEGRIVGTATHTIGADSVSAQATVRLTFLQLLLKLITGGRY